MDVQPHLQSPVLSSQQSNNWIETEIDQLKTTEVSTLIQDENSRQLPPNIPQEVTSRGLLFCHQNVNRLRNKFDEIKWFVETVKPTLLSVTESKLDPDRDVDNLYIINDYHFIRCDRVENAGGGTVIYVKSEFQYEILDVQFEVPGFCEVNVVKIKKVGVKPIIIVTVYKPPDVKIDNFTKCFEKLTHMVFEYRLEVLIFGDFNINLLDIDEDGIETNKFKFYLICKEYGLWQLIRTSTHNRGGLLDHIYVSHKEKYNKFGCFPYAGSDHKLCYVIRKKVRNVNNPRIIQVRSWNKIDWTEFKKELAIIRGKLNDGSFVELSESISPYLLRNIDRQFDFINSNVMKLVDKYAPLKTRLVKGKHNPWFNAELRKLINLRNKAHRQAFIENSKESWQSYRRLNNKRNVMLSNNKISYFQSKFAESCDSVSLWDSINELTQFRNKCRSSVTQLQVDNKRVDVKSEICDVFADTFVIKSDVNNDDVNIEREIHDYCGNYDYTDSNVKDKFPVVVTHEEVFKALSTVKVKKSHNPVNVAPAVVMKNSGVGFLGILVNLFSLIINNSAVPLVFKRANVMPLYKGKGSRLVSSNYRPISLLTDYCKIFEKFLSSRILERVESKLNDNQHAYRANRSCHTALTKFSNDVISNIDKRSTKMGAIFIDFSKAFDSIDHNMFVRKLMTKFNLEPWIVKISNENLKFRVFKVDSSDKYYNLGRGICQGSANGPLTFSLYINDISDTITIPFLMYADEIVIYTEGKSYTEIVQKLKVEMEKIQNWSRDNCMSIN